MILPGLSRLTYTSQSCRYPRKFVIPAKTFIQSFLFHMTPTLRKLLTLLLIMALPWQAIAVVAPGWLIQPAMDNPAAPHCAQLGNQGDAEHPDAEHPSFPKPCPHCHTGVCCPACQFPLLAAFTPLLPLSGFIPYPAPAQRGSWIIPDPPQRPPRP